MRPDGIQISAGKWAEMVFQKEEEKMSGNVRKGK
jgi:hypothetical protein